MKLKFLKFGSIQKAIYSILSVFHFKCQNVENCLHHLVELLNCRISSLFKKNSSKPSAIAGVDNEL